MIQHPEGQPAAAVTANTDGRFIAIILVLVAFGQEGAG
jgi:hypothetical protein